MRLLSAGYCKTWEMIISRRGFAENGREMYRNKKRHATGVQSFCLGSLNMQHLWRCRCRRVVDLKLPNCSSTRLQKFRTRALKGLDNRWKTLFPYHTAMYSLWSIIFPFCPRAHLVLIGLTGLHDSCSFSLLEFYNFVLTSMSLSERPLLYDIMGGSLKFRLAMLVAVLSATSSLGIC